MIESSNTFARIAYGQLLKLYRSRDLSHIPAGQDESDRFWTGLSSAWSNLKHRPLDKGQSWNGPAATVDELTEALVGLGVPQSAIRRIGMHTMLTLDNISFVYRSVRFFNTGYHLMVSPHRKGVPLKKSAHTYVQPFYPLSDFAKLMLEFDRSIPEISEACVLALTDARKESTERAIKSKIAAVMVEDIFSGSIPDNVSYRVEGHNSPADLDVVRLTVYEPNAPWLRHEVDIPLDLPRKCYRYLPSIILCRPDSGRKTAIVDLIGGIPFLSYR